MRTILIILVALAVLGFASNAMYATTPTPALMQVETLVRRVLFHPAAGWIVAGLLIFYRK